MNSKTIFKPHDTEYAIYCRSDRGPCFGAGALCLYYEPMNKENGGGCYVGHDYCHY